VGKIIVDKRCVLVTHPGEFFSNELKVVVRHVIESTNPVRAPSTPRNSSSSFRATILVSRFWVFWMRKTIKNVTIVVPVLMKSCQVSE
jgi:hypothetical protein